MYIYIHVYIYIYIQIHAFLSTCRQGLGFGDHGAGLMSAGFGPPRAKAARQITGIESIRKMLAGAAQ